MHAQGEDERRDKAIERVRDSVHNRIPDTERCCQRQRKLNLSVVMVVVTVELLSELSELVLVLVLA